MIKPDNVDPLRAYGLFVHVITEHKRPRATTLLSSSDLGPACPLTVRVFTVWALPPGDPAVDRGEDGAAVPAEGNQRHLQPVCPLRAVDDT